MLRTGTVEFKDIANLDLQARNAAFEKIRKDMVDKHGYGLFSIDAPAGDGSVTWSFDFDPSHILPEIDATFVAALNEARVTLCNLSAVKLVTGASGERNDHQYVPVDPTDENAVIKCAAINRIGKFLVDLGLGGPDGNAQSVSED